jgi:hypothetical protein
MKPKLRIYVEDLSGNQVVATETLNTLDCATNLSYSNASPKGHVEARFRLRRRDIYAGFDVVESYGVIVQDGLRVVWQGRIEGITPTTSGGDEFLDCRAVGPYVYLQERLIRKRWLDPDVLIHAAVPSARLNDLEQNEFGVEKRANEMIIRASIAADISRDSGEHYRQDYTMWANIDYVAFSYAGRCGENFGLRVYNSTGATSEINVQITNSAGQTGSTSATLTSTTDTIQIRGQINSTDVYDQNDWGKFYNFRALAKYHSSHSAYGSEAYTLSELVEDVLWLVDDIGTQISNDVDGIATIATTLNAFTVEEFTPAGVVIDRLASYSDSSNNTYLAYVWDREGTSDSLPKFELSAWDISDYEYIIDIDSPDVTAASNEKDGRQLYNWVAVQYVDEQGRKQERTPDDNANLRDSISIAREYQRMEVLKIGKATSTDADNIGERFIEWHKNRKWRGSITLSGDVLTKAGGRVPVEWMRAGERYYIPQFGETFFIRTCSINAETRTATITPDLPPDDTSVVIDKLRQQAIEASRRPVYSGAG